MESQIAVEEQQSSVVIDTPPTTADSSNTPAVTNGAPKDGEAGEEQVGGSSVPKRLPTKADFPPLSSVVFEAPKVNWGPNMKKPEPQRSIFASSSVAGSSAVKPMRSKTVQEAFSLDLQSQLSISKTEFSKFVVSVKQSHNVSIESTLSKNSRTFLILGSPTDVYNARREVVKKLTRPITTQIHVPSKTISAIIGPGGRKIKTITNAAGGIKIDISKTPDEDSYDEDLDDHTITITFHGDVASVNFAKDKILSIVEDETKLAVVRVAIDDEKLVPFISLGDVAASEEVGIKLQTEQKPVIVLSGPRQEVKAAKVTVQNYLNTLSSKIVEKTVNIPPKFQPLIDVNDIKSKFQVTVALQSRPDGGNVSFFGIGSSVDEAITYARQSSKSYIVESLEISKAHGRNVDHAKNLVLYFSKYNVLSEIEAVHENIRLVLPLAEELPALEQVCINIISKQEFAEEIKAVRKKTITKVNELPPSHFFAVDDLDYDLYHKDVKKILGKSDTHFIQLGDYYPGNSTIYFIAKVDDEDFKPSAEELKESLQEAASILDELRENQAKLFTTVVTMDSEKQEEYLSENAPTLALLLDDVNSVGGHALIRMHTPSDLEVTIKGDEKAVKSAAKIISMLNETSEKAKISFNVPTNTVSRLIGVKGANLTSIREKFDVQVDVPAENNDTNTEVTIIGHTYNAEHAKNYILAESKKWADIITKELLVPVKYQGQLIGHQGVYCTRLENKYNVRIQFPKEGETVTIRGPSRGVNKAHAELKALLDFEIENSYKSVVKVPVDHAARIIGKNGDTINGIRAEFGVELEFLQKPKEAKESGISMLELEITGSRSSIKDAAKKIEVIVSEAADLTTEKIDVEQEYIKIIVGPGGSTLKEIISKAGGDELRNKSIAIPQAGEAEKVITVSGPSSFVKKVVQAINDIKENIKASITKELNIPPERQGFLVGPGGIVRRRLESKYNVRLDIPDKGSKGSVKINGRPEAVEKCEKEIFSEIIRDSFDAEVLVPTVYHEFVSGRGQWMRTFRNDYFVVVRHGNLGRKANELSFVGHNIPVEKVRGSSGDFLKFTTKESPYPEPKEGSNIPWRLVYEPVDLSGVLGEDQSEPKLSKEEALEAVQRLIKERIELASRATTVGYVWAEDSSKFNKIVGQGGSNVKQLRDSTNTIINVPKKSDKVGDVVYIRGTKEGVEKAGSLITNLLKK